MNPLPFPDIRLSLPRLFLCAILLALPSLRADVSLPAIFSDHMVLQAGKPAAIWGKAAPKEKFTVEFLGKSYPAQAGDDGRWSLKLDPAPKGGPHELIVRGGGKEIRIQDVLVGEVWLCSGQSNMEMQLRGSHGEVDNVDVEIAAADYPAIRMFQFNTTYSIYELPAPPDEPQSDREGRWVVCSPQTVADFSAMGYFFGREIHRQVGGPVGLINGSVGGTGIEAWTSKEAQQIPELKPIQEFWQTALTNYDPAAEMQKAAEAKKPWLKARKEATDKGQPIPKAPAPFKNQLVLKPAGLFNAMIAPLIPYTMQGVIWYQGERNAAPGELTKLYGKQFATLIKDWRARWGEDFYFAFVQIANVQKVQNVPSQERGWGVYVREGQLKTLSVPKTGMAITIDIGGEKAGHPTNKAEFAQRLSNVVLHDVYGKKIPIWMGPVYQSARRDGDKMTLAFQYADGLKSADGELKGFAIAGADKQFVWAKARIENGKVVVWADDIKEPAAVRYSWAANPIGNLRNGADLPASPFRTDDW